MDKESNEKIKILLLAPVSTSHGGIANWTRLLLSNSTARTVEYKTIDTSLNYRVLGGKAHLRSRLCDLKDSFFRSIRILCNSFIYKPDIIYFTSSPSIGFAFRDAPQILLSKLLGRKVVIHLRGGSLEGFWGGGYFRRWLAGMGSKLADYIFVITRDCEAAARRKYGNDKVIYVPNFIDIKSANETADDRPAEINKDKFNIIHVAFQCREKGTFEIIQAAKELPGQVNILLIGVVSEGNKEAIEEAINENAVADKVTLLGPRDKPELWDYYKNADLFLFPTYSEGFPNVIMEAMLSGLPILAADVGNIAEMTDAAGDKPAAVLLENSSPPDPVEMADKIKNLIDDSELRRKLSVNGTERLRKYYSSERVIPQFEAVLEAISLGNDVLKEAKKYFQQHEISG